MANSKVISGMFTLLFCLFVSTANGGMSSSSYQIPTMVMSGGGGTMSSDSFSSVVTVGQSSPLENSSSGNYRLDPGYWYTVMIGFVIGDINGDGAADLKDVILALQIVTGESAAEIFLTADVDGDGRIGLAEAIRILGKLGGI